MENNKSWFLENGFFNTEGNESVANLEQELNKVLLKASHYMSNNQMRILQGNLSKLIGDKINEIIVSKNNGK